MADKQKIGVLFGGKSSEKEISLATGRYIYQLVEQNLFEPQAVFMSQSGEIWQIPDKLVIQNTTSDVERRLVNEGQKLRWEDLKEKTDVIFNALLGKYGEDGCIQGVLELLNIPYTGSGILACALAMDKKVMRELLQYKGYKVPKGIVINVQKFKSLKSLNVSKEIGFPCVVKPTREGSSVGVIVSHQEEELGRAIEKAFYFDNEVLVEEFVKGQEFMCVVWGNENPQAMLPTEVQFQGEIHTYESKYMPGGAQYFTPIRAEEKIVKEIQRQAVEIYKLLDMKGYGRVDGFVKEGQIYVGEAHTGTIMVPSSYVFHEVSRTKVNLKGGQTPLTPKMWVTKIIEMAQKAHKNKKGLL